MRNRREKKNCIKKDRDKKYSRYDIYVISAGIFLVVSGILTVWAAKEPQMAQWYSVHIYPLLVASMGRVSGIIPFSVSEVLIYSLLLLFLLSFIQMIWKIYKGRKKGEAFYEWFSRVFLALGILVFLYVAGCGINYHRNSFSEEAGISTAPYTEEELEETCIWLTEEVNERAEQVKRDSSGLLCFENGADTGKGGTEGGTKSDTVRREAVLAMEKLGEEFACLKGYYPQPKGLVVSELLSYQGLTGIYLPFTIEANYNEDMTAYNIPFTLCHELSHLRGFMQEQEANFIAFLACTEYESIEFQYSGYLSGWVYCMNTLYDVSPERWQETRATLSVAAEPDLAANNVFWEVYDGTVAEVANQVNDTYLKANGQEDGVHSYDRMVDLIVEYFYEKL
ncbi:DUF3810 domain-containing protein [Mediterraneibacter sp. NSJ-55]|uniref:DUF3810 domain-containing protein n=1 Tax=Mediterraneibacter hominis TaxID=2763054 RepID=A0A923LI79_9FIRM|nr:DUF3810 domain-containing protein [Mediterraneibacter hominis]MBC5689257.1 DUF3810 domain-containing protein [Mediterraneibacter hominis]